jgi:hypothetical protein
MSETVAPALEADIELTDQARKRFIELIQDPELAEHPGLKTELEQIIYQEEFLGADLAALRGEAAEPEPEAVPEPTPEPESTKPAGFTVGSLIAKD